MTQEVELFPLKKEQRKYRIFHSIALSSFMVLSRTVVMLVRTMVHEQTLYLGDNYNEKITLKCKI